MYMNTEGITAYNKRVLRYKHSMQRIRERRNIFVRFFQNTVAFGFLYIQYLLARYPQLRWGSEKRVQLFWGMEMILPAQDVGTYTLALYGMMPHRSERRLTMWMLHNLRPDDVLYDVGAHFGFYTALGAWATTQGEVHAFEANEKLGTYLKRNFDSFPTVYVVSNAVADTMREVDFYDATEDVDSSASSRFNLLDTKRAPQSVQAITLDQYVADGHRPPTVIKIDIEGGEYDALVGAEKLIASHKPRIIMEVWGGDMGKKYSQNAVTKLQGMGYRAYAFLGDGALSPESIHDPLSSIPHDPNGSRDNLMFIPAEK